jgi:hypothetical protein
MNRFHATKTQKRPRVVAKAGDFLHQSIPRVQCPCCGAIMRLARIDPGPSNSRPGKMTFDCECGFVYQQSARVRAGG